MNWTFDDSVNALYVKVSEAKIERQIVLAPGVIADVDAAGDLVGLEVLCWQPLSGAITSNQTVA